MTHDRDPRGAQPAGVSALTALTVGWVSFAALALLGLGMLSYFAELDVIPAEGAYRWAGIAAMIVAIGGFAATLAWMLRPPRPSYASAVLVGLVAALLHLIVVALGALFGGEQVVGAMVAVSMLVTQGASLVILLAGVVAAWIAIALRRTRAGAPHWPWEDGADPE